FPRADLRGQRGKLPARWLLETASRLEGRAIFSGDLESLKRDWYTPVPSFEGALSGGGEPASEQEYDLRSLLGWRAAGKRAFDHYLAVEAPELRAGLAAHEARGEDALSRWDGFVDAQPALRPSDERPASPTALQNWAACPFRYFLGNVLYVAETEQPEDALSITPLDRGNLVHSALETFIVEAPPRTSPEQPWDDDERALIRRIGERICDEFEAAGRTGRRLLWRLDRDRILSDLTGFLDADEAMRKKYGVVPAQAELVFGRRDRSPVIVTLASGSQVAFRGRIDRVDRAPDGSSLLVLDYKTGSPRMFEKLEHDPVRRGKLLQLPIYALAAQAKYGASTTRAFYWFVREQHNYKREGYIVAEPQLDIFRRALTTIVDGIADGLFPAHPGKPSRGDGYENCQICPYNRICPVDRGRVWERKSRSPELRAYQQLTEGQL
ncbi:MAG: PD-(D/E)XK nuclease family protein, partial [Dehalococcoidia bacterium]